MKTKQIVTVLGFFLTVLTGHAQQGSGFDQKLIDRLNEKVAPTIKLTIVQDSGTISFLGHSENLSLKSPKKKSILSLLKSSDRQYNGPIYWIYGFPKMALSSTTFQIDSLGRLQLLISFKEPGTITISARQNGYGCVSRASDVRSHKVNGKEIKLY